MQNSYKTSPVWSGGLSGFSGQSQEYLPRGQDNREGNSVLESKKEQGHSKQNCTGISQLTCANQRNPLPSVQPCLPQHPWPWPMAWQAPSHGSCYPWCEVHRALFHNFTLIKPMTWCWFHLPMQIIDFTTPSAHEWEWDKLQNVCSIFFF